jgi:hypothetical protein
MLESDWKKREKDLTMEELVEEVIELSQATYLSGEIMDTHKEKFAFFKRRLMERIEQQDKDLKELQQISAILDDIKSNLAHSVARMRLKLSDFNLV